MDESRLSAIKARVSAATPGTWVADHEFGIVLSRGASHGQGHVIATLDHEDVRDTGGADLALIAAAREDVRDLVAEVERLTTALAAMTAERERCAAIADDIAKGADNALVDATIPTGVAYLRGLRDAAEKCAKGIRVAAKVDQ